MIFGQSAPAPRWQEWEQVVDLATARAFWIEPCAATLRRRISSVVDGVGLDQVGIKLVLGDELAEAVADLGSTVVSVLAIDRLGWELLRLPDCLEPQHQPGGIPHVVLVRDT